MVQPALFGIVNSNRDFTNKEAWGKNQFNSSFPASLVCYMAHKKLDLKYLTLSKTGEIEHKFISSEDFLGIAPDSQNLFFAFENVYQPYQKFVVGNLPRIDLVSMNQKTGNCLKGIEIKLTALPDETTFNLPETEYGTEIVVRPDTIVYLALSIIIAIGEDREYLKEVLSPFKNIKDWTEISDILPAFKDMSNSLIKIMTDNYKNQSPLILQPVWKTLGKSQTFADNAFDVFIWSNFASTQLFTRMIRDDANKITRHARSVIWVIKMLYDYAFSGKIDHTKIIDTLSYNTKNDKAFATSGVITHALMHSTELNNPRIKKSDIKNIILGGGEKLLSPERRLDAVILSNLELFGNK